MKIIFYIFLLVNLTFTYSRESIITQIRLLIDYKNNTEVCGGRNYYIKEGPVVNFTSEFQESIKLKVKDSFDMFLLTFTPDFSGQIKNIPDIKYWNKHPFAEFGLIGLTNTLRQNIYFSNLHSRQIVSFPKIQEILKTLQSNQPENGILKIIESYLDFHASDTSAALKNLKIAVALPQMSNQSESLYSYYKKLLLRNGLDNFNSSIQAKYTIWIESKYFYFIYTIKNNLMFLLSEALKNDDVNKIKEITDIILSLQAVNFKYSINDILKVSQNEKQFIYNRYFKNMKLSDYNEFLNKSGICYKEKKRIMNYDLVTQVALTIIFTGLFCLFCLTLIISLSIMEFSNKIKVKRFTNIFKFAILVIIYYLLYNFISSVIPPLRVELLNNEITSSAYAYVFKIPSDQSYIILAFFITIFLIYFRKLMLKKYPHFIYICVIKKISYIFIIFNLILSAGEFYFVYYLIERG